MKKKQSMELTLDKYDGMYLMRDDNITYELRKYNLSDISQKFLFGIMYKISADFIEPYEITESKSTGRTFIYSLNFDEIKDLMNLDYRIESIKPKIEKKLEELISTPISISVFDEEKKRKEVVKTNLIEKAILSDTKENLYIAIDERLLPLYKATADKFTLWHFDYISFTEKKYTPRLYEYLVEFAKSIGTKNIDSVISKTVDIDVLMYELSIPKSYKFDNIKKQILEPSKEELLGFSYENSEDYKLFKSFEYIENYKRKRGAGRRPVSSITFNFELLEKTKKLLRRNKGEEVTNKEKLEKRAEEKSEFYYTIGNILARCENKNAFMVKLTENTNDFTLRTLDIKNDIRDNLNITEIQDVAFERALIFTLENLKTSDIEEFEYNFRINLEKNIEYWKNRTGKGNAKPKKIIRSDRNGNKQSI